MSTWLSKLTTKPERPGNNKHGFKFAVKHAVKLSLKDDGEMATRALRDLFPRTSFDEVEDANNEAEDANNEAEDKNKESEDTKEKGEEGKEGEEGEEGEEEDEHAMLEETNYSFRVPVTLTEEEEQKEEEKEEQKEEEQKEDDKTKPREKKGKKEENEMRIEGVPLKDRIVRVMPPVYASLYYMNNRKKFVSFINQLFQDKFGAELQTTEGNISCDNIRGNRGDISLLTHQKIVREYINLQTPYRGLLLYHGLGSGKTCTSIAIAEGIQHTNRVIVMTPASLQQPYVEEIKKCGDLIYRKKQFWEWIDVSHKPRYLGPLSRALMLPVEFLQKQQGAWLVNMKKPSNFDDLTEAQKKSLNEQLDAMIRNKYTFINYNGLSRAALDEMLLHSPRLFDNSVVIIDEAHNLISRIVNKLNLGSSAKNTKKAKAAEVAEATEATEVTNKSMSVSLRLYNLLQFAQNCRVVLLTGTPIINYPNEIGVLFNILRGVIPTWSFQLSGNTSQLSNSKLRDMFRTNHEFDYVHFHPNSKVLTITRNPLFFSNRVSSAHRYEGVQLDTASDPVSNDAFEKEVLRLLSKNGLPVQKRGGVAYFKALPDNLEAFVRMFFSNNKMQNTVKFQRRILGLTSYFRSAEEGLMPAFDRETNFHVEHIPMSNFQFNKYEVCRQDERPLEKRRRRNQKRNSVGELYEETASSYRVFSRLACNFVFPFERPMPSNFLPSSSSVLGEPNQPQVAAPTSHGGGVDSGSGDEGQNTGGVDSGSELAHVPAVAPKKRTRSLSKHDSAAANKTKKRRVRIVDNDPVEEAVVAAVADPTNRSQQETKQRKNEDKEVEEEEKVEEEVEEKEEKEEEKEDHGNNLDENVIEISTSNDRNYNQAVSAALQSLDDHPELLRAPSPGAPSSENNLSTYSPKYLAILKNIQDPSHEGLHLVYSQFRTLEGIGIFGLVLKANGFAQLKVKARGSSWMLDMAEEDRAKPWFALYTGSESEKERGVILNIFNSAWDQLPGSLVEQLQEKAPNNFNGDIVKVLMITSAGSEGISLRNTRFVHIMEPYWHPVRLEQVIGRARRICSHQDLPEEKQTVDVFLYLMMFTSHQLNSPAARELIVQDRGEDGKVQTSDETLYEISMRKERLSKELLKAIKEASIDCALYENNRLKEGLTCLSFGANASPNSFSYHPDILMDENDQDAEINQVVVETGWNVFEINDPAHPTRRLRVKTLRTDPERLVYEMNATQPLGRINGFDQLELYE